jgi:glucose/arabinose dehydrogenase
MQGMRAAVLSLCLVLVFGWSSAWGATPLTTERVASSLVRPVFVTAPPSDTARLFIVEKAGVIKILNLGSGVVNPTPFLDIDALVGGGTSNGDERGLLGLAFDPEYGTNGFFYVNYTNNLFDTVVARYEVSANPDIADSGSAQILLTIDQPFSNHNGGWMAFGPDGMLHIATGDGGSSCDPAERAQDVDLLLGKILRIDVSSGGVSYDIPPDNPFVGIPGADEIWAYGLRNPWRDSFDRVTGDLYIADVGQGVWEEINIQPADSTGGENYGWDCMEGNHCASDSGCPLADSPCTCLDPSLTDPEHEYSHGGSPFRCSITGGYVYRSCDIPDLRGTYFFADYCSEQIWSFRFNGSVTDFMERTTELAPGGGLTIDSIVSFGEDDAGELYIVDQATLTAGTDGEIYKIVPAARPDPPSPHDYDNDGFVTPFDTGKFVDCLSGPDMPFNDCLCDVYDVDTDSDVDLKNFASFQLAFGQ